MRKLLLLAIGLLAAHVVLLFVHPGGAVASPEKAGRALGIVFDVGGRGDKSFNDGAYRGGELAQRKLGVQVRYIEPGDGPDREAGLRLLSAEGMNLVVGVGFIFSDDLAQLAREYPRTDYAGVDFALQTDARGDVIPPPPNLAALKFREEEGSFLVGAIAALAGGSKKIGFVGGMDSPLIHKFEAGYRAGVRYVCPDCSVIAEYAGATPDAFRDPTKGKELALSECQAGARVVFHAAGSTGLGVFEAARETGNYAIGVDADQYAEAPGHVLTSMVKNVDQAVYDIARRVDAGTFRGGIYWYGLKEGGVGYVYDEHNRALIPDAVQRRVEQLRQDIIAGRIHVPTGS